MLSKSYANKIISNTVSGCIVEYKLVNYNFGLLNWVAIAVSITSLISLRVVFVSTLNDDRLQKIPI